MRTRIKRAIAGAVAVASAMTAVVVGMGSSPAAAAPNLLAYGIAGNGTLMLQFWTDTPDRNDWVRRITGLSGDTAVIGIDFRVQDGKLYAVGNQGGIYTIGIPSAVTTKVSQLQVPLYGTNFGVDFNPAADRLRVISDNGQNLRHNLNDHTTVEDTTLTTPPTTGPARGVTAAAYTNNDLNGTTNTTLFDINTTTDQVVIQSPANNGLLVATGNLGFDALPDAGFDIFADLNGGKTFANIAFASLTPKPTGTNPAIQNFYSIDLLTATTTLVGAFPLDVTDVAVALDIYPPTTECGPARRGRPTLLLEVLQPGRLAGAGCQLALQIFLTWCLWRALYDAVAASSGLDQGQAVTYAVLATLYGRLQGPDRDVARDTVRQHIWSGTIVYWRRADRQIVVQGG